MRKARNIFIYVLRCRWINFHAFPPSDPACVMDLHAVSVRYNELLDVTLIVHMLKFFDVSLDMNNYGIVFKLLIN